MRAMRSAFLGILGGVLEDVGTLKLPGMSMSSSYGPENVSASDIVRANVGHGYIRRHLTTQKRRNASGVSSINSFELCKSIRTPLLEQFSWSGVPPDHHA